MGLGGILILLMLIVSLILFIYFVVVTARGWGVLHTILLCTLFIECWVFLVFTAGVHYKRVRYTADAAQAQKRAEDALALTKELLYGRINDPEEALTAVIPVKGKLRRMTVDRGRVWRQLTLLQSNADDYLLEMAFERAAADPLDADPAGAAAVAGPNSESLPADLVVYAFAEEISEDGYPEPKFYLGEFIVTQSQAGNVTVRPTLPLKPAQKQKIASGESATWMLYELLPIDSHTAFANDASQPSTEEIFGRMDPDQLNEIFAGIPNDNGLRDQVVDLYLKDGKRASADAEPETVWVQVNMLKPHDVDVDSQEEANATVGGYFDSIGRSVDVRLKRDEEGTVQLSPSMTGELIVLKEEAARDLIAAGKAEAEQRIFVRPLNDYEDAFNHLFVRDHEVSERIELVKRDSAEVSKANTLGVEMISFRQVENQKLASDLSNYKREVDLLNNAVAEAEKSLSQLKSQMSQLFRTIQQRESALQSGALKLTSAN